jgi:hypothetical protein
MSEKLTRRELIKKTARIGAIAGGAVILGGGAYSLLRQNSIEELYGTYPEGAAKARLALTDPTAPKPNIVLIYCDDLGYGDIGCNGATAIRTPNIDSLAPGLPRHRLLRCNAVCAPSRAGLLTGRYPFRTGSSETPIPRRADRQGARAKARRGPHRPGGDGHREKYVARGISDSEITWPRD